MLEDGAHELRQKRLEDIETLEKMGFHIENQEYTQWPRGGNGMVCACTFNKESRRLVVKMPNRYGHVETERMEMECETLAILTGAPHSVQLAAIHGQSSDLKLSHCTAYVMKYVPELKLRDIKGQFEDGRERKLVWGCSGMLSCMRCLVQALQHLHSTKMFHGDIKVSNVMIDPSLQSATLSDFGLTRTTADGLTTYGTPGYRAPELITGSNSGKKRFCNDAARAADIWALGVVALGFSVFDSYVLKYEHADGQQSANYQKQDKELGERASNCDDGKAEGTWTERLALEKVQDQAEANRVSCGVVWSWAAYHALMYDYTERKEALREFIKRT